MMSSQDSLPSCLLLSKLVMPLPLVQIWEKLKLLLREYSRSLITQVKLTPEQQLLKKEESRLTQIHLLERSNSRMFGSDTQEERKISSSEVLT